MSGAGYDEQETFERQIIREGGAKVTVTVETSEGKRFNTRLLHGIAIKASRINLISSTIYAMADLLAEEGAS